VRAKDISFDAAERFVDNERDAYCRREMKDRVAVRDQALHHTHVRDRTIHEVEEWITQQMGDVASLSSGEIVENRNRMPLRQQSLGEMRADEPRPASNQETL
jgi:hypothetical protein